MVSPESTTTINDVSAAAGLRGKIFENWNFDLSNTYGKKQIRLQYSKHLNATLRENLLQNLMLEDWIFSKHNQF
jgi:iron complex outermembrane receptor protein